MKISQDIYQRIVNAKIFLDENFHLPINLSMLSRRACLSRFHFHRLFTQIYKKTPHQYLVRRRMDHAGQLLTRESISVTEVCNAVGFESISSFSGLFKKHSGIGPRKFRSDAQSRLEKSKHSPGSFIPSCFGFDHEIKG
jgi:AraC-like DNA-binding protein